MLVIVDYDTGNIANVENALNHLGIPNQLSKDRETILNATGLILPGVGAYKEAMHQLEKDNLVEPIQAAAAKGIPILGICLGAQLLFEKSYEFGESKGLGLIPGEVVPIPQTLGFKVPHMGWNNNIITQAIPLAQNFAGQDTYFVHSFYIQTKPQYIAAKVQHGIDIPSIVCKDNLYGFQFHPEKSGPVGLKGLQQFEEVCQHADIPSD